MIKHPTDDYIEVSGETEQEDLLKSIVSCSLMYANAFFPDKVGKHADEPADVAVHINDFCFLFYCKDSKLRRSRLDESNIGQGKKWARLWDNKDRLLKGKNAFSDFNISKSSVKGIFVISVVPSRFESCLSFNLKNHYINLGLISAVSVPIDVLEHILQLGANCTDLVNIFNSIIQHQEIDKSEIYKLINTATDFSLQEITNDFGRIAYNHNYYLSITSNIISGIRSQKQGKLPGSAISCLGISEISYVSSFFAICNSLDGSPRKGIFIAKTRQFGDFDVKCIYASNAEIVLDQMNFINSDRRKETITVIMIGTEERFLLPMITYDENLCLDAVSAAATDITMKE